MKIKSEVFALIILILFSIFSYYDTFESVEYFFQDSVLQSRGQPDTRVSIIAIDETSLDKLGMWPWPRKIMADMINKLSAGKPSVIGIDVILSQESSYPEGDKALVEAAKKAGNVVFPAVGWKGTEKKYSALEGMESPTLEVPFPTLGACSKAGHITTVVDSDNIVRKSLNAFRHQGKDIKSFASVIYEEYMKKTTGSSPNYSLPQDRYHMSHISFVGKPDDFEHASFYSVLSGEILPEYFEGKIVLIGPYALGMMDSYLTPLDRNVHMNGIEIHANIIQNFINQTFKLTVPDYVDFTILFLSCIVLFLLFKRFSPAKSAIILVLYLVLYIALAKYVYAKGFILQLFYPMFSIVLLYLMTIIYRYIEEFLERKRITDVFGKYVAPQVVKEILDNGEEGLKLGGIRREITALFVDIRGFTPMSEKCQPEEVVAILNDYLNLCAESIFKYGGTLDKFIGDATMAIFNAPLDLEDHAFKAVQTAWAMKEGSEKLRKVLEEKFGRSVQFGIGINTGYAVVGNIGAKFRMDYTAIGDTVNTAARLESNSKPGQILMSQATYDLVKDRINAASLGEIKVKGKEHGIPVYELEGIQSEFNN
ncbi:MAG: adenylate/guanylate cyclase domain-containing protein [Clostridia bacterium]|nr:adenylate/guanylate cyclase domain-containing protein [Clostridia bacterium]